MSVSGARSVGQSIRFANRTIGLAGLGVMAVLVGLAGAIAPAPPDAAGAALPLLPPSRDLAFGSDALGRDVLSETLHGLSVTAGHATLAAAIAIVIGALGGFFAARLPWQSGLVLRWLARILKSVPTLLLGLVFIGISGRSFAALAAGLAIAPSAFARSYDRALTLATSRHAEFARATGISWTTLVRRDLVYEVRNAFLTVAARALAAAAVLLATVSFFGFGATPPHRDLGLMIGAAYATARATHDFHAWWTALFPALALVLLIFFARLAAAAEEEP
jgi:peptide/nickel transport system permease protein